MHTAQDNDSDYDHCLFKSDKEKQKSTTIETRSLSVRALQDIINGDIRRVASITGLSVSSLICCVSSIYILAVKSCVVNVIRNAAAYSPRALATSSMEP
jgi:hypothetical protein